MIGSNIRIADSYVDANDSDINGIAKWEWNDLEELQPYIELAREKERKLLAKIEKVQKKKTKKKVVKK